MIKGPKDIVILLLAAVCLVVSLVFLPWSELNFTGNFPDWLSGVMDHFGVNTFFDDLAKHNLLIQLAKADGVNLGDYAYSLFLFIAMTAAAIAIILIGKEDNSEKTVLEAKK